MTHPNTAKNKAKAKRTGKGSQRPIATSTEPHPSPSTPRTESQSYYTKNSELIPRELNSLTDNLAESGSTQRYYYRPFDFIFWLDFCVLQCSCFFYSLECMIM
ncbi:hypothetical protein V6N13_121690 [Hibiscus sabdariffa]|uniref:Uncharacterized protein n=1 Tax=Hibiscus sabdariffa TaxID=183260 RepID=A0ABR2AMM0_9ROSI